ncbi:MAG: hypothetical protein R3F53_25450 [Gammaproteobacteria bacterium]
MRTALCGPVYLTPRIALADDTDADDTAISGEHVIGATFQAYERDPALRAADDQDNLQRLQHWLPDVVTADASVRSLFANVRAATPGRVPVVGRPPMLLYSKRNTPSCFGMANRRVIIHLPSINRACIC